MSVKLYELAYLIADAAEYLASASDMACEASGDACGWPAMGQLSQRLAELADLVKQAVVPEIAAAFEAERAENDHLSDLADGASY